MNRRIGLNEGRLLAQIARAGLPLPEPELRFHPERRWRFDLAWPDRQLAVEVEGGGFVAGRHARGSGFEDDCVKYNEAALLGWTVLRVTPNHVKRGEALAWIERALGRWVEVVEVPLPMTARDV